ncbi:MAG: diphthine synthase [Candidatus Micrarchaeota archaeon]
MLVLVGIGIWDEKDVSLRGLEELKTCDIVFAEQYTHRGNEGSIKRLGKLIGKEIVVLDREEVEGEKRILDEAEDKKAALIVGGDPMISTTHISLVLAARKRGIKTQVIHASSIFTAAVGETGMQIYKFGKTVTLPFWRENYKPTTTYDVIEENKKRGLHTMVFLDISEEMMVAREALEFLLRIENEKKKGVVGESEKVVVLSRVGSAEQSISFGAIGALKEKELGKPPFIIIVPGKLHFLEEEALGAF